MIADPDTAMTWTERGMWSDKGLNDTMRGGSPASEGPTAHVHGVRLRDHVTAVKPITLEEYKRREAS